MSFKDAQASNWVAEIAEPTASGFNLKGSSKGYATFDKAFSATQTVFYSAHDSNGNREAGVATFNGSNLVDRHPTATLVAGIYSKSLPSKVQFSGEVTVACTFNASAFNTLWAALDKIDPDGDGDINIPPELIDGLVAALDSKAEQADLDAEIAARIAGDKALQDQIDALGGGGGASSWDELTGKPTEFPPEAHTHKWDEVTDKPATYPPEDHNHDSDYAAIDHKHPTSDVNGLDDALKDITQDITDLEGAVGSLAGQLAFGGSYNASTGLVVEANLSGYTKGQPLPDASTVLNTFVIVTVAGDDPEELNEGDWLVAGSSGWVAIKYGTVGLIEWDNIVNAPEFLEDAPEDGEQYARQDGSWEIVESSGAGMVISETEPDEDDRVTGMQWLDVGGTEPYVWIWDEDKWVQFPASGGGSDDKTYTLPVSVRGGDLQLPLHENSTKLLVDTRSGPVELPLMAA